MWRSSWTVLRPRRAAPSEALKLSLCIPALKAGESPKGRYGVDESRPQGTLGVWLVIMLFDCGGSHDLMQVSERMARRSYSALSALLT